MYYCITYTRNYGLKRYKNKNIKKEYNIKLERYNFSIQTFLKANKHYMSLKNKKEYFENYRILKIFTTVLFVKKKKESFITFFLKVPSEYYLESSHPRQRNTF